MPSSLDHLLWAAADLGEAVRSLEARTGVRAAPGGRHPDLGTHNALAALGRKTFLEVIAPDPELESGALARQLATLEEPRLLMWAARTRSAKATAARAERAGYRTTVVDGRRPRPDGSIVTWTNVFVAGHGAGTMVPFFIEWHDGGHPADDAPKGLALASFTAQSPRPAALRAVLAALDVELTVRRGPSERLVAVMDTPRGRVELTGP